VVSILLLSSLFRLTDCSFRPSHLSTHRMVFVVSNLSSASCRPGLRLSFCCLFQWLCCLGLSGLPFGASRGLFVVWSIQTLQSRRWIGPLIIVIPYRWPCRSKSVFWVSLQSALWITSFRLARTLITSDCPVCPVCPFCPISMRWAFRTILIQGNGMRSGLCEVAHIHRHSKAYRERVVNHYF